MFRVLRYKFILIAFGAALPTLIAVAGAGSPDSPALTRPAVTTADEQLLQCRAAEGAADTELERLRQSCEVEVAAFEACRASRPAWSDVELFSCGLDISAELTRGELDDTASIEDCGSARSAEHRTARAECPVPACEADLERLEEAATRAAC